MSSVTVDTTSVEVVPANSGRQTITFTNRSVSGQVIYIDNVSPNGMTVDNAAYVLAPGAAISLIKQFDGNDIKQNWSAVSDIAGAILYIKETSEEV